MFKPFVFEPSWTARVIDQAMRIFSLISIKSAKLYYPVSIQNNNTKTVLKRLISMRRISNRADKEQRSSRRYGNRRHSLSEKCCDRLHRYYDFTTWPGPIRVRRAGKPRLISMNIERNIRSATYTAGTRIL